MKYLILPLLLALPACSSVGGRIDSLPPSTLFAGDRRATGIEMSFGRHSVGVGLTYRLKRDWKAPDAEEGEPPINYPLTEK